MPIEWHLETRKLSDLRDYHKNPRKITKEQFEQLKRNIDKFGLIDKPFINTDNTIIGGHQRLKLLKKMGKSEIEVQVPSRPLDEREIEELNIRHNQNQGEWDWDILANQFNEKDLVDWGFSADDLQMDKTDLLSDEDESEQLDIDETKEARTKLGDVYELNGHRLVCGDSTMPEIVQKCLNGGEPILMVTDPPYGVEYDASWRGVAGKGCGATGKVKNDDQVNWSLAWNLFPGSVAYVWCASWFLPEVAKHLEDAEFERKSLIIWAKQHFSLSRGDYHWQHEPCWYAIKKGHNHNWQGSRKEATVWEIANLNCFGKSDEERTAHSTQKPLECMARPIRNNTCKGEAVYDPFLGSGTTLIAAESLNRTCYGIELSPHYCDIIVDRWVRFIEKNQRSYKIKLNGEEINLNG